MKWNNNGIKYLRGCHLVLVAQFDGNGNWWAVGECCTQQAMKAEFKKLGEFLGAEHCEVKRLYNDDDVPVEKPIFFRFGYDGTLFVGDDKTQKYYPYKEA